MRCNCIFGSFLLLCCIITSSSWNCVRESSSIFSSTPRLVKTKRSNHEAAQVSPCLFQSSTEKSAMVCERITSQQATELIERSYNLRQNHKHLKKDEESDLLLITSDASRGANRHCGLTSILRHINLGNEKDKMTIVSRRNNSMDARDIFQSEVAALVLGIKTAMQCIPRTYRKKVLLLTDSNSALTFFCGDEENVKSPTFDHPQYRFMQNLLNEADDVFMAKVKSAKSGSDGFFDHDAADVMSSFMKNISNRKLELYFEKKQCSKINIYKTKISDKEVKQFHAIFQTTCDHLSKQDLEYLFSSSISIEENPSNIKKHLALKRASGDRLKRCRDRIRIDLDIDLDDISLK